MTTIEMSVSDDLVELLGSPEAVAEAARRELVLSLLRRAEISQGKAAELLGISRYAMINLAAEERILSGSATVEELEEELAAYERAGKRRA